jgi:hypothetical protein
MIDFNEWFEELKRYAITNHGFAGDTVETLDPKAFKDMYFPRYSPQQALDEDMSYA